MFRGLVEVVVAAAVVIAAIAVVVAIIVAIAVAGVAAGLAVVVTHGLALGTVGVSIVGIPHAAPPAAHRQRYPEQPPGVSAGGEQDDREDGDADQREEQHAGRRDAAGRAGSLVRHDALAGLLVALGVGGGAGHDAGAGFALAPLQIGIRDGFVHVGAKLTGGGERRHQVGPLVFGIARDWCAVCHVICSLHSFHAAAPSLCFSLRWRLSPDSVSHCIAPLGEEHLPEVTWQVMCRWSW